MSPFLISLSPPDRQIRQTNGRIRWTGGRTGRMDRSNGRTDRRTGQSVQMYWFRRTDGKDRIDWT